MSARRSALVAAVATTAIASGAVSGCDAAPRHPMARPPAVHPPLGHPPVGHPPVGRHVVEARPVVRLSAFDSCDELVHTLRARALQSVTAYGLGSNGYPGYGGLAYGAVGTTAGSAAGVAATGATAVDAPAAAAAPAAAGAGSAADSFSTTNDQEAGVDEPDLVKTDGHVMVVARPDRSQVEVLRIASDGLRRAATVSLPMAGSAQLFLTGPLVVAIGPQPWTRTTATPTTVAAVVDVADPATAHVVRTFRVPGSEVDARLVGGRVVLVQQGQPALSFPPPVQQPATSQDEAQERATAVNRRVVQHATVSDWLPPVTTSPQHRVFPAACSSTWYDAAHRDSGLSTVSVVTFDPASEGSVEQTTVVGTGGTVYASTTRLYVASMPAWLAPRPMAVPSYDLTGSTQIDGFDIADPSRPRYLGSGVVPGQLTDQYAMSDQDGFLRVATTVGVPVPAPGEGLAPRVASDNRVTVLQAVGQALVPVGSVRGLGRGEKIYGVRFLGDLGYVVTFRQIDPLYVLDLSDPLHPREVSHLDLTGYSAYLHPLGDGLLFGLGRKVDARAHPVGEQLSVFDVASPQHPALRDRLYVAGAESAAEYDHHAFLWWPKDRLLVVPMSSYTTGRQELAVFHIGADGTLTRTGRVVPPQFDEYGEVVPQRSVVIGDVLYTVTSGGVLANRLHGLEQVAWLPFR